MQAARNRCPDVCREASCPPALSPASPDFWPFGPSQPQGSGPARFLPGRGVYQDWRQPPEGWRARKICRVPAGPGRTALAVLKPQALFSVFLPHRTGRQRPSGACQERKSAGFPAGPDWNPAALAGIRPPPEGQLCRGDVPGRQTGALPRRAAHLCA